MAKVSIVMPAYNASLFIKEAIDSVIGQSFGDWELIVVDDCSSDTTFDIVHSIAIKDKRIKLFRNDNNLGVAGTRNVALKIASGDYVAFLDADDLWASEKLEKQINFMEKNHVVFSFSYYQSFSDDYKKPLHLFKAPRVMTSKKILGNTAIGCLTVAVNRKIVGEFFMPSINHSEDTYTWYSILCRGFKAYCITEALAYYRVSPNSLSSSKRNSAKSQWLFYRKFLGFSFVKSLIYFLKYVFHACLRRI